ncbi:sucrose porin [Klebsiella michiganensis]|nr:sucrose porin [Klebsiella michiganensis]
MLAYHGDSFYGLRPGSTQNGLLYGRALGRGSRPGLRRLSDKPGTDRQVCLLRDTSLTDRLSFAPLIVAQSSNSRYIDSDHYDWGP